MIARRLTLASLTLLLCFGVSLSNAADGPRLSDVELFRSLDLDRPELAEVRRAFEAGDLDTAKHAFAEYLRNREAVHWWFDPKRPDRSVEYNRKMADDAVEGKVRVRYEYQFPDGKIDWRFNATSVLEGVAFTKEWQWQPNRMYFWPAMGDSTTWRKTSTNGTRSSPTADRPKPKRLGGSCRACSTPCPARTTIRSDVTSMNSPVSTAQFPRTNERPAMSIAFLTCLLAVTSAQETVPIAPVEIRLDVGDPSYVVRPGDEDRAALMVHNKSDKAIEGSVHMRIESYDGAVAEHSQDVTLAADGMQRIAFPKPVFDRLGIKWVTYHWEQDGVSAEPSKAAFAYMRPTGPGARGSDGFIFAIAFGAGPDNLSDEASRRSSLCGMAVNRANPRWGNVQPKEGVWNWEIPDRILQSRAKYGMDVQWLVSYSPRWSRIDPDIHTPRTEPWRRFCYELAKRYADRVELYEIWNEPDIGFFNGTIEDYLEMLPVAYDAIKEADPTSRVTTGGFASLDHHQRKAGMAERVIEQCQDSYDLIANHKHGEFDGFVEEFEHRLVPLCVQVLDEPKPIYLTETGMDTRRGQHFQAQTLPKKIIYAWANGCVGYTWFNLHDMVRAEHDRQPGFTYGLYTRLDRNEGTRGWDPEAMDYAGAWPKAAYVTHNTLAGLLRDTAFTKRLELGRDQYAYLFAGDGRQTIAAWNENPRQASPHLVIRTSADQVEVVDLMGNRQTIPTADGRVLLEMSTEPTYWVFRGSDEPMLEGLLAAPVGRFVAIPDKPVSLSVEIWNPTSTERTLETSWEFDERLEAVVDEVPETVRLSPGERRTAAVAVRPRGGTRIRFGAAMPCRLTYQCRQVGWSADLQIPVTMGAVAIPQGAMPKDPLFRLRHTDQVVNLSEHDPHTAHLLWKGPDDLSANVRAARTDHAMELLIDIQDNEHHAPKAAPLGQADHLELLLLVSGHEGVQRVRIATRNEDTPEIVTENLKDTGGASDSISLNSWGAPPWRHYRLVLPNNVFGLSDAAWQEGVRFNLRVYDNDGKDPKGSIHLAPGATSEDALVWPLLLSNDT